MNQSPENLAVTTVSRVRDSLLILAAVVVILAGARFASNILVPLLLAAFIAIICGTPINKLSKRGLPTWLASIIVAGVIFLAIGLTFLLLSATSDSFIVALPEYQIRFTELLEKSTTWLIDHGVSISKGGLSEILNPAAAVEFFGGFISGIGDTLGNFFLILFLVIFLLADSSSFPAKLAQSKSQSHGRYLLAFQQLVVDMNGYITAKAWLSLLTGGLVWFGLWLLGVDFAVLWGLLAFLLNFIPNIGSIAAAVPPVLLSILELNPLHTGLIVALYLGINMVIGNVIEPRWMGQKVGLSALAVFLSLIFWGWMFGAVGMLLSVPLTMTLKFLAMQNPGAIWLAVLLSNAPEATEDE